MKQKNVLIGLVAVALIGALSGSARAQFIWFDSVIEKIQVRESMKVGVGLFEPWVMCNTAGELIGFEVEIAEKIAEEMEVELELVRTYWPDIIPDLIDEEFDVIISGMTVLAQRNLRVNFTAPTAESGLWIVANKTRTQGVTKPEDLNVPSITFAVRAGATPQTFVENEFPRARVQLFDSEEEIFRAVIRGRAHVAVVYGPTPVRWIDANPDILQRLFEQEAFYQRPEAIALRKGDVDALNFFNSWIAVNRANGWLEERRRYWFETREWAAQVATNARVVAQCEDSFQ